ncbi:MAG: hypothetical protein ACYC5O_17855 [Anaerolineae bacterium]
MERRRRELMAGFGVALTSFLTLGCRLRPTPMVTTCYAPLAPTPTQTPMITCYTVVPVVTVTPTVVVESSPDWGHLRALWLDLDGIAEVAGDNERGPEERDRLIAEHEATLGRLVAAGLVDEAVAADMQVAYAEAAFHVWRLNSNMTCYVPAPYPEYSIESRAELLLQAQLLEEMAAKAALDADTVTEARAAIERDIAYMSLTAEEQKALIDRIVEEAGQGGDYPSLDEVELEVPPASAEAARVLVQLLLGKE